jgi:hypothetical protein
MRVVVAVLLALEALTGTTGAVRQTVGTIVPAPREVLGFEPGDDYRLADFGQLREYFRRLADASPRVRLSVAGRSTEGHEMLVAVISSEENLARLDRYRDIARRLALARNLSDADARALAREGKAIVWIDNGLHASEVATAQHAFVLAHRVATDESAEMRAIRDNVILVLLPCINPDGMNMVVDWYRKTLNTPHQDSPMPWLYQKYVGHDNNRDSYMQTQTETEVVSRLLFHEWLPQVMYNQHQGTWPPRIFVPPFPDPVNPNIDPQIVRGVDLVGGAMLDRFAREGKDGVISRYQFSFWYNGSVRTTTYFHNMIGILTETGHDSATPYTYRASDFPATLSNGDSTSQPSVTYPTPWKGGTLRLRDAMEYMLTGSLGVLEVASKYRERFLYGIYQVGARQIHKGLTEAPFAYAIPPDQHDRPAADLFVATLMKGAIEVHEASRDFEAGARRYPAGTRVVLLAQPFRPFAKDLIEPQVYPDLRAYPGGPPIAPYDTAGWTLSYQMGVRVDTIAQPFDTSALRLLDDHVWDPASAGLASDRTKHPWDPALAELTPASNHPWDPASAAPETERLASRAYGAASVSHLGQARDVQRAGTFDEGTHRAKVAAIEPAANASATVINRLLAEGASISRTREAFTIQPGVQLPPGTWLVEGGRGVADVVRAAGLRGWAATHTPAVARTDVRLARIGLYKSWVANIDEGWTRWIFEQYGFPYASLADADVRAGHLRARFDVIVLPDQSPRRIVQGHRPDDRPSTPGPWNPVPPQYQGGIGEEGVAALKAFVEAGGTLVTLDEASDLAIERFGGIFDRIKDVTDGLSRTDFYCPGSVLRVTVDTSHPLASGMDGETAAYFQASRAFEASDPAVKSVVRYAAADRLLMSGWLLGAPVIAQKHALLEVPYGRGRVVLFGFRPQFRAQSHATFKLLFNALYVAR